MTALQAGTVTPAPTPWIRRAARNNPYDELSANSTEPTTYSTAPTAKTRPPHRAAAKPDGMATAPKAKSNADVSRPIWESE